MIPTEEINMDCFNSDEEPEFECSVFKFETQENSFLAPEENFIKENMNFNFLGKKYIPIENEIYGNDYNFQFKLEPFSFIPPKSILISSEDYKTNFSNENIKQNENINTSNLNNKKQYLFKVKKKNKKLSGRKRNNLELKEGLFHIHDKYCPDNILRKINCDYINYLVHITNEILKIKGYEEEKELFLKISYELKKDITRKHFEKLKKSSIGEILQMDISKKYSKTKDPTKNKKLFDKVIEDKDIKDFFNEKYLYVFSNYYYTNKKKIKFSGLEIDLKNIKTFEDLLNKSNDDENGSYKEKMLEVVQKKFIYN